MRRIVYPRSSVTLHILRAALVALASLGPYAQPQAAVVSGFDADLQGWRVTGDNAMTWQPTGGNPGGWVVESSEGNFYYSGDTALASDMALIGESTRLKFAVLCIGDTFTMGIDDAIRAARMAQCDEIVGVHYDTFPPIKIDHAAAVQKFKAAGKTLHLVPIGQSVTF